MNKVILSLALSAALASGTVAFGQNQTANNAPTAQKQQKLAKVATIRGADAIREFQQNVQLLQAQRQAAIELSSALEKEKDPAKKKEIKSKLDAVTAKLNENNAAMTKAYGFSLTRNYTMEFDSANIYMLVSDEEAAKIEQAEKEQAKKAKK